MKKKKGVKNMALYVRLTMRMKNFKEMSKLFKFSLLTEFAIW